MICRHRFWIFFLREVIMQLWIAEQCTILKLRWRLITGNWNGNLFKSSSPRASLEWDLFYQWQVSRSLQHFCQYVNKVLFVCMLPQWRASATRRGKPLFFFVTFRWPEGHSLKIVLERSLAAPLSPGPEFALCYPMDWVFKCISAGNQLLFWFVIHFLRDAVKGNHEFRNLWNKRMQSPLYAIYFNTNRLRVVNVCIILLLKNRKILLAALANLTLHCTVCTPRTCWGSAMYCDVVITKCSSHTMTASTNCGSTAQN